ncbi:MAG: NADP oxidoreductase [Candidatus Promineifilaceae bacterium]|jgi:NAD-reducing hydrogenase small subunit
MSEKPKVATVWLDGCSGCHMSFLDIDEHLLELNDLAQLVYSPLVDNKEFPPDVVVTIVEGAVSTDEDYEKIRKIRGRTQLLVALGDCAITSNVPGMRNEFKKDAVLARAYLENADENQQIPLEVIPPLRKKSVPVHQVVDVDVFVPGCPPSAETIWYAVSELLHGRMPDLTDRTRFGV